MNKLTKKTKKDWNYLVTHFVPDYLENMSDPREYVIGYGKNNKSFCYLVEYGLKDLGEIRGSTSAKYGLWYGTQGKDKIVRLRATKQHFERNPDTAFSLIKKELARIIREALNLAVFEDLESPILSPVFKRKVIYLYNPKIMLPSFIESDLRYFEQCLGLVVDDKFEMCQKRLLDYKDKFFPQLTNHEFTDYLYRTYGGGKLATLFETNDFEDDRLNRELEDVDDPVDEYVTRPQPKAKPQRAPNGILFLTRNPRMAAYALKNARHMCENNPNHKCFIKRSNGKPYTEVHHLIPLCFQGRFENSLDVPENIISLCSSCHNEIHYGKDADILIEKLFRKRKPKLGAAGISITLEELLEMYHQIFRAKRL